MTQLTDKVWAVPVPVDAFGFCINSDNELGYYANIEYFDKIHYIPLPFGTWRFLFTTKAATEEDARKVVREFLTDSEKQELLNAVSYADAEKWKWFLSVKDKFTLYELQERFNCNEVSQISKEQLPIPFTD